MDWFNAALLKFTEVHLTILDTTYLHSAPVFVARSTMRCSGQVLRSVVHPSSCTQQRSITSYLRSVFLTGSLSPVNPILESLQQQQAVGAVKTKDGFGPPRLPQFSLAQPHHVQAAVEYVQQQQQATLKRIMASCDLPNHVPISDRNVATTMENKQQLDDLLRLMDQMEQPAYTLRQVTSLLWLLSNDEATKAEWHRAAAEVSAAEAWQTSEPSAGLIHTQLRALLLHVREPNRSSATSSSWAAATLWLRKHEVRTGQRLLDDDGDDGNKRHIYRVKEQAGEEELQSSYPVLTEALHEVEQSLLTTKSSIATPQTIARMYNYIGIRTEQAKLLGYPTVADQVLAGAAANLAEIRRLHVSMKERIVPLLRKLVGVKKTRNELALDAYLSGSGGASSSSSKVSRDGPEALHRRDKYMMLKLEHHVTLDGALQFVFRLVEDLLGVSFALAEKNDAWNSDVQLYHAFDETNSKEYLGSFYLDPFQREGKLARSATIPIFARGPNRPPLVCLSIKIDAPAWDTDPPVVTWEDCESLFHEFGHVLQFLLAHSESGVTMGPQNMPLDVSEFLPKFMEMWLTEKSTLYAMIDLSKSETPLSDESIDAACRVTSREKALKLAQHVFYGSLELELFSGFDLKGPETILALQERLALELIPHDVPDKKDLTALLDIFQENAQGQQVAWYRYVWCEVLSAACFDRFKKAYTCDPDSVPKLREDLRHLLLEPGAAVDFKRFRSEFGLVDCSPHGLWQRFGL